MQSSGNDVSKRTGPLSFLRNVFKAIGLVWETSHVYAFVSALVGIVQSFFPLGRVWVGKLIIDAVIRAARSGGTREDIHRVFLWIGVEFALVLGGHILDRISEFARKVLGDMLSRHITAMVMRKATDMDVAFYENGVFYDKLQRAHRESGTRPITIMNQILTLGQSSISACTLFILLYTFNPVVMAVVLLTTLPYLAVEVKYARRSYMLIDHRVPEGRKQGYLSSLLTGNFYAKEIKLFKLGEHLLDRSLKLLDKFVRQNRKLALRKDVAALVLQIVSDVGSYGSYLYVAYQAILQHITIGSMTMYIQAIQRTQGYVQRILGSISGLYENHLFISDLFSFLALQPQIQSDPALTPAPLNLQRGIEFRNVSFRYPGKDHWVLKDINLRIDPGEKIAVVGRNGSGKTTLVKLLVRFYDPTEGVILVDGRDIREYDVDTLRDRIGVIFQDYVRYNLTLKENIGFGNIQRLEDLDRIVRCAQKSGAGLFVKDLPQGYDTVLGWLFDPAQPLSIGEWQKIALARAFMRDAQIMVLDEPTAALDPKAEYDIFRKFAQLMDGTTSILISHRFSTVRMADRIVVMEDGRIVESGTHDALMNLRGMYADLFTMQAAAYR